MSRMLKALKELESRRRDEQGDDASSAAAAESAPNVGSEKAAPRGEQSASRKEEEKEDVAPRSEPPAVNPQQTLVFARGGPQTSEASRPGVGDGNSPDLISPKRRRPESATLVTPRPKPPSPESRPGAPAADIEKAPSAKRNKEAKAEAASENKAAAAERKVAEPAGKKQEGGVEKKAVEAAGTKQAEAVEKKAAEKAGKKKARPAEKKDDLAGRGVDGRDASLRQATPEESPAARSPAAKPPAAKSPPKVEDVAKLRARDEVRSPREVAEKPAAAAPRSEREVASDPPQEAVRPEASKPDASRPVTPTLRNPWSQKPPEAASAQADANAGKTLMLEGLDPDVLDWVSGAASGPSTRGQKQKADPIAPSSPEGEPAQMAPEKQSPPQPSSIEGQRPAVPKASDAQAKPEQAKAEQAKAEQAKAEQAKAEQAKPEQAKPNEAKANEAKANEAKANLAGLDKARVDEAKGEQAPQTARRSVDEPLRAEQAPQRGSDRVQAKDEAAKVAPRPAVEPPSVATKSEQSAGASAADRAVEQAVDQAAHSVKPAPPAVDKSPESSTAADAPASAPSSPHPSRRQVVEDVPRKERNEQKIEIEPSAPLVGAEEGRPPELAEPDAVASVKAASDGLLKNRFQQPARPLAAATSLEEQVRRTLDDEQRARPYRRLTASCAAQYPGDVPAALMLTGPEATEQVGETIYYLAAGLADLQSKDEGCRILVVDAALAEKSLSAQMQAESKPGLAEVLGRRKNWHDYVTATGQSRVDFLPAGEGTVTSYKSIGGLLAPLVNEWKQQYRYVLLDAGAAEDPLTERLAPACDATYLLVTVGETEPDEAYQAADRLQAAGARMRGCVVADARSAGE